MKYKLLVSDMDETLFNSEGKISKRNKAAIQRLLDAGGKFALASGRVSNAIVDTVRELGLDSQKHIANNGATIFDAWGFNETLHTLQPEEVHRIVDQLRAWGIQLNIYTRECIIHDHAPELMKVMARFNGDYPVRDGNVFKAENPFLIYGMITDEESKQKMFSLENEKTIARLGNGFVFFMNPMISKYNAALHLAKSFGIKEDEIVCVGDGGNDLDMIRDCHMGVAVQNADENVKEVADVILDYTNDEDAVAHLIEDYFLEEKGENRCIS